MKGMSKTHSELSELNRVLLVGGSIHFAKRLTELVGTGAAVTIIGSSNDMTSSALDAISNNKATRQIDRIDRDINIEYDIRASLSYNLIVICMNSNNQARYSLTILPTHTETSLWQLKRKEYSSKLLTHQNPKRFQSSPCLAPEYLKKEERPLSLLMELHVDASHRRHIKKKRGTCVPIRLLERLELPLDTHPQASMMNYG
jgi:hypothetical protein